MIRHNTLTSESETTPPIGAAEWDEDHEVDLIDLRRAARRGPRPTWAKRICSLWKSGTATSAAPAATVLRALPFDVQGRSISEIVFHIQGSITTGQTIRFGIYSGDANGMPDEVLWESSDLLLSSMGNGIEAISTDTITPPTDTVWVAYYLSAGTTQFGIGGSSGVAESEFGLSTIGNVNLSIVGITSGTEWSGAMPDPFNPSEALITSGTTINMFLMLPAPA
jgi:hypothetical protein